LFSTSGTNYEADIVASSRGVRVSLTAKNYDTHGFPHVAAALANLSASDARRLAHILREAAATADTALPSQPGIWSNSTIENVARRLA